MGQNSSRSVDAIRRNPCNDYQHSRNCECRNSESEFQDTTDAIVVCTEDDTFCEDVCNRQIVVREFKNPESPVPDVQSNSIESSDIESDLVLRSTFTESEIQVHCSRSRYCISPVLVMKDKDDIGHTYNERNCYSQKLNRNKGKCKICYRNPRDRSLPCTGRIVRNKSSNIIAKSVSQHRSIPSRKDSTLYTICSPYEDRKNRRFKNSPSARRVHSPCYNDTRDVRVPNSRPCPYFQSRIPILRDMPPVDKTAPCSERLFRKKEEIIEQSRKQFCNCRPCSYTRTPCRTPSEVSLTPKSSREDSIFNSSPCETPYPCKVYSSTKRIVPCDPKRPPCKRDACRIPSGQVEYPSSHLCAERSLIRIGSKHKSFLSTSTTKSPANELCTTIFVSESTFYPEGLPNGNSKTSRSYKPSSFHEPRCKLSSKCPSYARSTCKKKSMNNLSSLRCQPTNFIKRPCDAFPPVPCTLDEYETQNFHGCTGPCSEPRGTEVRSWIFGGPVEVSLLATVGPLVLVGALIVVIFWNILLHVGDTEHVNPHPILMMAAQITLPGLAALSFHVCFFCTRKFTVWFHVGCQVVSFVLIAFGIASATTYVNDRDYKTGVFYTIHGVIGVMTFIYFIIQMIVGSVIICMNSCMCVGSQSLRVALFHSCFGLFTFLMSVACAMTGLTNEQNTAYVRPGDCGAMEDLVDDELSNIALSSVNYAPHISENETLLLNLLVMLLVISSIIITWINVRSFFMRRVSNNNT